MMEFVALSEEEERERKRSLSPSLSMSGREGSKKAAFCKPGGGFLPEPDRAGTLI